MCGNVFLCLDILSLELRLERRGETNEYVLKFIDLDQNLSKFNIFTVARASLL